LEVLCCSDLDGVVGLDLQQMPGHFFAL
jgi:hypothetical protein